MKKKFNLQLHENLVNGYQHACRSYDKSVNDRLVIRRIDPNNSEAINAVTRELKKWEADKRYFARMLSVLPK